VVLRWRANPNGIDFWVVDDVHGVVGEFGNIVLLGSCFEGGKSVESYTLQKDTLKNKTKYSPASALDTVGLETMTGTTPGALVMASKCTKPIRPIPITPTLITLAASFTSTFIDKADLGRKELFDAWSEKASVEAKMPTERRASKSFMAVFDECC
jgi:hypothetical protein